MKAVGAWICVFGLPQAATGAEEKDQMNEQARQLMDAAQSAIRAAHDGDEANWDGVCLAIGWPDISGTIVSRQSEPQDIDAQRLEDEAQTEEWEDLCFEYGFEFVDGGKVEGRNAMGELQGIKRVREALEANEWEGGDDDGVDEEELLRDTGEAGGDAFGALIDGKSGVGDEGFLLEKRDMEREFMGLKMGMANGFDMDEEDISVTGEAQQVEELERMMGKMMAVKGECTDASAGAWC